MFEQEIQHYTARGAALTEGRDTIALADITASTLLPDPLKSFFRAEAHALWREELAAAAPSRFDRSHADVRALDARIEALAVPTAVFTRDEYADILSRAVKLTFNYLCRPQLTLRSFVFRGAPTVSIDEALLRISYFHDYSYFRSVLHPWLERKRSASESTIAADVFARTLAKIDEQLMEGMTVQDLHSMLQPMFRWIADAQTPAADRIATDAYVIFFDDKNIGRIASHLATLAAQAPVLSTHQVCIVIEQLIQDADGATAADAAQERFGYDEDEDDEEEYVEQHTVSSTLTDEIAEEQTGAVESSDVPIEPVVIEPSFEEPTLPAEPRDVGFAPSVEPLSSPFESAPVETLDSEDIPPVESSARDEEIGFVPEMPAEEPGTSALREVIESGEIATEPEYESIVEERGDFPVETIQETATPVVEPAPAAPMKVAEPAPAPPPKAQTLGAVMSRTQFGDRNSEFKILGARPAPVAALTDIRSQITDEARKKFIKKLFRRNDPEYERALDALNALHTWKEASTFIDSLFLRFGVDPYAKLAIQFTDVVYSRFVKVPSTERS